MLLTSTDMGWRQEILHDMYRTIDGSWAVVLRHTLQEGNGYAAWLAKAAFDRSTGTHKIAVCPSELQLLLFGNIIGVSTPHI